MAVQGPVRLTNDSSGYIWVTNQLSNNISKIDPATGNHAAGSPFSSGVQEDPFGIVAGVEDKTEYVWITNFSGRTMSKLKTADGTPGWSSPVSLPQPSNGADGGPAGIALADDVLWVAYDDPPDPPASNPAYYVKRRKPSDGAGAGADVQVGLNPADVTAGGGYVWAADTGEGMVHRIDPASAAATAIALGVEGPAGMVWDASESCLWVAVSGGQPGTGNPPNNKLARIQNTTVKLWDLGAGFRPHAVASNDTYLWITRFNGNKVVQIKKSDLPASNPPYKANNPIPRIPQNVMRMKNTGRKPTGVLYAGGKVWVANYGDASTASGTNLSVYAAPW